MKYQNKIRHGLINEKWHLLYEDHQIGPAPKQIASQPDPIHMEEIKLKKKKISSQKIRNIKNNKLILEDKINNGKVKQTTYDPQNGKQLRKLDKEKMKELSSENSSSDPEAFEEMEEEIKEEIDSLENLANLDDQTMIMRITNWEQDEGRSELEFIPRIYVKNFKKIKQGLRKTINEIGILFREIIINMLFGTTDLQKQYIQAVYARMTFVLKRHIFEKIGKKKDLKNKRNSNAGTWRGKRKQRRGINDNDLEECKRENQAE
jgi:hypothetical protein